MPPSAAIAGQIASYDKNRVTSTDALNSALSQYGVPEIRNTVSGLRTTLANTQNAYNAVDPSVTGRTQGSLVTEAQRTKQVSNERAPIAGQIGEQSKALSDNQTALQDAMGQATTLATNKVNDYNTGRQALQSQYDMAYTGEQNVAKQEAERQAAARAQSNDDRNYALNVQQANTKASAASAKAPTKQDVLANVVSAFTSKLNRGKDGFVGQGTWNAALNDWIAVGGNQRDFWNKFSREYVNPQFKEKYSGWAQR